MSNDFFERVYDVVRQIPDGKVTTYGAIARYLGAGRSARLVGYALKAVTEDLSMILPCHRVLNRNGELSGKVHFATSTLMREMLESEGIQVRDDRVDIERYFWDPAELDTMDARRSGRTRRS